MDRMIMQLADQMSQTAGMGPNMTATLAEAGLPPLDSSVGFVILAIGAFSLVVLPALKVLVGGGVGLYLFRNVGERFKKKGGPNKAFRKLKEQLTRPGGPDVLASRKLKVTRLTDELGARRASVEQKEKGDVVGANVRDMLRRERSLRCWHGVLPELDLTAEEKVGVGKALNKYLEEELVRREEQEDLRQDWVRGLLRKSPFSGWYEGLQLSVEMEKQLELEAELIGSLSRTLPEEKVDKLLERFTASEEPLWLADSAASESEKCVYVLSFDGDPAATRVQQLQREVSALLAADFLPHEVVLRINAPGGTVTGFGLAAAQLMRLRSRGIKLTVCIDEVAASGGYLMACCADQIFCAPFAAVGSIGVVSGIPNFADRLDKEGIRFSEITAGKFKRTVTPFKNPTDEDRAKVKEDLSFVYQLFQDFVKANRPAIDLERVATGEVWFGSNAMALGLVDGLQTSQEYMRQAVAERQCEVLSLRLSDAPPAGLPALFASAAADDGELVQGALTLLREASGAGGDWSRGAAGLLKVLEAALLADAALPDLNGPPRWPAGAAEPRFQDADLAQPRFEAPGAADARFEAQSYGDMMF